jgi:iron complex transport system ATP-binding protein
MLQVQDISFSVGTKKLLDNINFQVNNGEFVAILGPNGAGKSTLIKQISGQTTIQKGKILWKDKAVHLEKAQEMAKKRAVLTQQAQVAFDFSVESVVLMGRYPHFESHPTRSDQDAVNHCIEKTDMSDYIDRNIQTLSGGEQQRTHIARVLTQVYEEPSQNSCSKLLLLDEPLNNLDIRHQHNILQLSADYAQQQHIVLAVLHDINLAAMYASKILLMKNGKVLAFGEPEEILTEELLTECYDFPARVTQDPFHQIPQVHFGCPVKKLITQ